MRLWHKDLITVLPRQQLLGQWRECCLIAKNIKEKDTPNHILVNKIMDYPLSHFCYYGRLIECELVSRGYKINGDCFDKWLRNEKHAVPYPYPEFDDLFKDWYNDRYLVQCWFNLQEKFDCGGISADEWTELTKYYLVRSTLLHGQTDTFLF